MFNAFVILMCLACFQAGQTDSIEQSEAVEYLTRYGYLSKSSYNIPCSIDDAILKKGIKLFQKFSGLNSTGEINEETANFMNRYRCGRRDVGTLDYYEHSTKTNEVVVISGDLNKFNETWKNKILTYSITKYPKYLNARIVDDLVVQAFAIWSEHADLTFYNSKTYSDITITFAESLEADYGAFYPADKVLAMSNPASLLGEIYMNDNVVWTTNLKMGNELLGPLVHQIGHILGMKHSSDVNSIMSPFQNYNNVELTNEDIENIKEIYGKSNQSDGEIIGLCDDFKIDSIFTSNDGKYIYIFKGSDYWMVYKNGTQLKGFPKSIAATWGISGPIEGAYQDNNGLIYLFKSNKFWRYQQYTVDKMSPYIITDKFQGYGISRVKAVAMINNNIYIMDNSYIHKYEIIGMRQMRYLGKVECRQRFATFYSSGTQLIVIDNQKYDIYNIQTQEFRTNTYVYAPSFSFSQTLQLLFKCEP